jgi:propanol-preferring alcohol dehydrogenase
MVVTTPIPSVQKAVIVKQTGKNWIVKVNNSYPVPALNQGQALVRLSYTGVCHSDLSGINGTWNRRATCDVPGHEGVGRIIAYHPDTDLSTVPPLDTRVGVPLIRHPCMTCDICKLPDGEVLCHNTSFHGMQSNGTYQQYIAIYTSYLVRVPESVPDPEIAPILCGGVTSYKAIKKSGAKAGDWIVIAGAGGGLGNFAVQYGVAMGMRVIGIDTGDDKRKKTLDLAAAAFVDYRTDDVPKKILEIAEGGAAAVIVLAGSKSTYTQALEYVRVQGCIVSVGLPHEDFRIHVPPGSMIHQDITLKGSMVGTRKDIGEALDFVVRGLVKPNIVVHPLEDITDIYQRMEKNEVIGRAVLKMT